MDKRHFKATKLYYLSNHKPFSWNELHIGQFYYHIHLHTYNIKTGNNSYFCITDNHYSHRSKLLQKGGNYKNFIDCSYVIYSEGGEERPQGEWLSNGSKGFFNPGRKCSLCGKVVEFSENYCPNCGADMRGDIK